MKIRVLSDLHNEFAPFELGAEGYDGCDVIVLAGDIDVGVAGIQWAATLPRPVIYVAGNHELYHHRVPAVIDEMREAARETGVTVLERNTAVVDGVRFLGATLWTDFALLGDADAAMLEARLRMSDFRVITSSETGQVLAPVETVVWHGATLAWLERELARPFDGPTVIVTHHAPSLRSSPERYQRDPLTPAFNSHLDERVAGSGAALWIHGHTHHNVDYVIGDTRVVSNQRGYPGEGVAGFNPTLAIEV